jgi:hypothetical protein
MSVTRTRCCNPVLDQPQWMLAVRREISSVPDGLIEKALDHPRNFTPDGAGPDQCFSDAREIACRPNQGAVVETN